METDADVNAVGRSNNNRILDTREYSVDFDDREVRKMTANVISESMYSVCDDSLNEYLTIYSIVNCWNNDKAITVYGQKVVQRGRSFMRQSGIGC